MTSTERRQDHDDSGEYSDASQDNESNNIRDDGAQLESDYDSQGSDSEHSEQDPEKQEADRRVDDDEDRSNPQYIPKRGTFYEHDDRTAASGEESSNPASETILEKKEGSEAPPERRRAPRKSEIIDRWSHDKYNENEQVPKSSEELVAIYGYDIRNEDAPPHARRNRRYGRGPNKYTRTWEDEEAYKRQGAPPRKPSNPPNPEDFPELEATKNSRRVRQPPRPRSKSQPTSNESLDNHQLRRNGSTKSPRGGRQAARQNPGNNKSFGNKTLPRTPTSEKMPPIENLTITATVVNNSQGQGQRKVNASVAQQRPVPTDLARKKQAPSVQQQQNSILNKPQQQSQQQKQPPSQQQQQSSSAESKGGSKRYSTLRQRPLAEPYVPQQQQQQQQQQAQQQQASLQQQQRYHADYAQSGAGGRQPANSAAPVHHQMMHQVHRSSGVGPTQGPGPAQGQPQPPAPPAQHQPLPQPPHAQQVRLGMMEPPQLVPHHTMHNMPQPHAIGQIQPSQGYAPPAIMPAQFMQSSGNGGVYAGAAMYAQPAPPYPHQMYPHHNYATQAGGVTYYSPVEQEQQPQPRAQRRPTAAIPIVRPANTSEKDNIDRIVENMFQRKPWQAQDSKEKPQSETRNSQEPQSKESSQASSLSSTSTSAESKPEIKEEKTEEVTEEERKPVENEIERMEQSQPQAVAADA